MARADADSLAEERALAEIDEALKRWAFGQREGSERASWLRQVERLREAGLGDKADSLIEFAERNARWDPIT